MRSTAMVHVRLNERVKARAEKALDAMGLSVSDAVRMLLTRVAAEKALPFEVKVPNARTRAAIEEIKRGKAKRHATVDALLADLNAGD
ncbi:MAG: type II toxin-antitoxin system RelB/DinJ family antitoxin [Deltaproteobacteria bacterium]